MEQKEFTPITTQEAFDAAIKDRLARQSEKHTKEIAERDAQIEALAKLQEEKTALESEKTALESELAGLKEEKTAYSSTLAEKDKRIADLELKDLKTGILAELNLPNTAIEFLTGDTEEDVRACAERLAKLTPKVTAPMAVDEQPKGTEKEQALREMLKNLH